jgi:hypothetical protein
MRAAFENIKSFQSREFHASDLAQGLSEDHISKLKLSKNKTMFTFFDRYFICFDIKQTS